MSSRERTGEGSSFYKIDIETVEGEGKRDTGEGEGMFVSEGNGTKG